MSEHAPSPYYKIFAWLAAFTIAEIAWAVWFVDFRIVLILGQIIPQPGNLCVHLGTAERLVGDDQDPGTVF